MSKFKNIFRVESTRLKNWDYHIPWWYYVTINTKNHIDYFGGVVDKQIQLNTLGKIAGKFWNDIPYHFRNVELDYYIIMPNHIHGIIILNPAVETPYMASLPLGDVVGKFKAAVTRYAHKNGYTNFSWQARFYDRIIRNEKELYRIRKYIMMNPFKWELKYAGIDNSEI